MRLLNAGESYIADVPTGDLAPQVKSRMLDATSDPAILREADDAVVSVRSDSAEQDQRSGHALPIVTATDEIMRHQHDGMLVATRVNHLPGHADRPALVPKLTEKGAVLGSTVFIAFSPERVDPGNQVYKTKNTPKVLGGASPDCLAVAAALYSQILDEIVPVSSTETAEMVKLLENTFRAVNIGLVNEIAMMSRKLGIDPFEVIRAAATKPFGFMPFYPGPGLGGHCIPVDPLYMSWKLRTLQYQARFIELADSINSGMPRYVVERVAAALNDRSRPVRGSTLLIYGVAYKRDVRDVRESPALVIIHELKKRGASVTYMDPHVPELAEDGITLKGLAPAESFASFDAVVIVTDHTLLERERLLREANLIVDTRDALHNIVGDRSKVYGL